MNLRLHKRASIPVPRSGDPNEMLEDMKKESPLLWDQRETPTDTSIFKKGPSENGTLKGKASLRRFDLQGTGALHIFKGSLTNSPEDHNPDRTNKAI